MTNCLKLRMHDVLYTGILRVLALKETTQFPVRFFVKDSPLLWHSGWSGIAEEANSVVWYV